jgi:hypothetical protein
VNEAEAEGRIADCRTINAGITDAAMVNAYTKIVTPAQAEANRANGRKGGRRKGKIPPQEADARKAVAKTLQERCQQNELQHAETLESIAGDATQPASARIAAIFPVVEAKLFNLNTIAVA